MGLSEIAYNRLPQLFRWIIDADRTRAALVAGPVVSICAGHDLRVARKERDDLRRIAHELYGKAPIKGENGPGTPIALRA